MTETTVRISGVPEHFNLPWKLALKENRFQNAGINLEWTDAPSGTGAMCQALRNNEIDVAVLLTEGALKDIQNGNPSKVVSFYTDTPLVWGVHSGASSQLNPISYPKDLQFAISRFTSGSHLMAYVYAKRLGRKVEEADFAVINDLAGARKSLANHSNQVFLWEKYTTKFLVDNAEFQRIDEIPTPWPAFVVVASNAFIDKNPECLSALLSVVQEKSLELKQHPDACAILKEYHGLNKTDSQTWLKGVDWSQSTHIDLRVLDNVATTLQELGLMHEVTDWDQFVTKLPEPFLTH